MAKICIETNNRTGTIRRLHGSNLAAPISFQRQPTMDISEDLRALDIPLTRLHDAPLDNHGFRLVDIHHVFPLFHHDHHDPRNYFFDQTDDYIALCLASGTKVMYRLGESIEHSAKQYFVHPPQDYDKWAEICCNIIAHYNEGWAAGFHHNIEYWTIWEEANTMPELWTGTWSDYVRLYVRTAKKIKQRFPNLKVGGPAMGALNESWIDELLSECKKHHAPLDFFSWNIYSDNPGAVIREPEIAKRLLGKCGFKHTELHIAEWHYLPFSWQILRRSREDRREFSKAMGGIDSAAFIAAVLCGLQDTPITMANHYVGTTLMEWGLFDNVTYLPNKNYFAMKAFNLLTKYDQRLHITPEADETIWTLAGRKATGETAVMVSCFKSETLRISLTFEGLQLNLPELTVHLLDGDHDLTPIQAQSISGNTITLEKPAGSAIFLVEYR